MKRAALHEKIPNPIEVWDPSLLVHKHISQVRLKLKLTFLLSKSRLSPIKLSTLPTGEIPATPTL